MSLDYWSGRIDAEDGESGNRWHQVVKVGFDVEAGQIVLIGYASDEGVIRNQGRPGARLGPRAIRRALSNLPSWRGLDLLDLGDVEERNCLESFSDEYAIRVARVIQSGGLPIGLGGGHDIAWGTYKGLRKALENDRIGIINIDAHFDLRLSTEMNSGTSFSYALRDNPQLTSYCVLGISRSSNTEALFKRAEEHHVWTVLDEELSMIDLTRVCEKVKDWSKNVDSIFLTVCLDVFPAGVSPGVSAPAARGVGLEIVEPLISAVLDTKKLRAFDVAECNPELDIDNRTSKVAARLIWNVAKSWSLGRG